MEICDEASLSSLELRIGKYFCSISLILLLTSLLKLRISSKSKKK